MPQGRPQRGPFGLSLAQLGHGVMEGLGDARVLLSRQVLVEGFHQAVIGLVGHRPEAAHQVAEAGELEGRQEVQGLVRQEAVLGGAASGQEGQAGLVKPFHKGWPPWPASTARRRLRSARHSTAVPDAAASARLGAVRRCASSGSFVRWPRIPPRSSPSPSTRPITATCSTRGAGRAGRRGPPLSPDRAGLVLAGHRDTQTE